MKQTQEQIENLRSLKGSYNVLADAVENQLPALADKIDNIKLPEIDTTELAKQGSNQDATMTAVMEELMKLNGSYADQIKDIVGE